MNRPPEILCRGMGVDEMRWGLFWFPFLYTYA
jgi:hypothetical protein